MTATTDAAPDVRRRLVEEAARLLGEEGPSALTARRLAAGAETSTMAVYTHFGGMPALVREVAAEGFRRLIAHVDEVEPTDDPVDDLRRMAVAYRANALENPHLYAVMFGSASLGGYRPHEGAPEEGAAAFDQLVAGVDGRWTPARCEPGTRRRRRPVLGRAARLRDARARAHAARRPRPRAPPAVADARPPAGRG